MKNAIVLCSGGLDSVVTSYYIKKKLGYDGLIVLFFDYSQKTVEKERECAKSCCDSLGGEFNEIKLDWLEKISNSLINKNGKVKKVTRDDLKDSKEESEKYYVPCRNTIFLSYALALADSLFIKNKEIWDVFVGFKCEGKESYPDTTQKFVEIFNKIGEVGCSERIKILAPLIEKDKEDIIKLGEESGVDFRKTISCYIGKEKHCGCCLACRLRQEGFYWAGIKDPTEYKERMKDFR